MCATEQPAFEAGECGESADSREPDGSAKRAERSGLEKREGRRGTRDQDSDRPVVGMVLGLWRGVGRGEEQPR
jgi:hypothetical protein